MRITPTGTATPIPILTPEPVEGAVGVGPAALDLAVDVVPMLLVLVKELLELSVEMMVELSMEEVPDEVSVLLALVEEDN
jgi:hypothetical protein